MPRLSRARRIELSIRDDGPDVSVQSHRDVLTEQIADHLGLGPDEEIEVVDVFPRTRKLLLELPEERVEQLARAVRAEELTDRDVVDCYLGPVAPSTESELEFARREMVRWFRPYELVRAGLKALLSSLFGSYADQREMQALRAAVRSSLEHSEQREDAPFDSAGDAPDPSAGRSGEAEEPGESLGLETIVEGEVRDYSDRSELWIDYVADLGDGFAPTYTIARLLAEGELTLGREGDAHRTERGNVLVMGGDQVYPTATRAEYTDRLRGPYRAALPAVLGDESPDLFAIPGNHDWYDGLTSFTRLFCQQRWIGGWKTRQERSYFAVRLPHDWWLWGIDVQLDSDIDYPQFEYFRTLAERIEPGSDVVLCTAEPSWVYAEQKGETAYQNLEFFERKVIRANDLNLAVALAGDLHTYARYEGSGTPGASSGPGPRQRIVAGGGGAYLYPSHQMPQRLDLPRAEPDRLEGSSAEEDETETFARRGIFPDVDASKRRAWGALALPLENWQFAGLLGAFYTLFAWLLQSASLMLDSFDESYLELMANETLFSLSGFGTMWSEAWSIVRHSPPSAVLLLLLIGGLAAFSDKKSWWWKIPIGVVHGGLHVQIALLAMCGFVHLNVPWIFTVDQIGGIPHVLLFTVEMLLFGGLAGGFVFGVYLLAANRWLYLDREMERGSTGDDARWLRGVHANELFSCQSIPDYKNFLRLHVREDGDLEIYPIGVREVEKSWTFRGEAASGEPWFEPSGEPVVGRAELIEGPIVLTRS